jgi:small conductance mechanosensitive channel
VIIDILDIMKKYKINFTDEPLLLKGVLILVSILLMILSHIVGKIVSNFIIRMGRFTPEQILKIIKSDLSVLQKKSQIKRINLVFATLGKLSYYFIILIAFFFVLRMLGIESGSLIALIGTIGFSIGLAMQGTLSDISSGIIMAFLQTFSIGEIVQVNDLEGKVIDFNILNTQIEDIDTGNAVTVPNRLINDSILINHTRNPVKFLIYDYAVHTNSEDKLDDIITEFKKYVLNHPEIIQDPGPEVYVQSLSPFGTTLRVRVGINSKNYEKLEDVFRTDLQKILVNTRGAIDKTILPPKKLYKKN